MAMITKIFNAIDDQEQSGWAVDAAVDIARATSSMLVFFMANPIMPGRGPVFYRYTKDDISDYFDQARKRARFGGVYDVKCITKDCIDIARAILVEAQMESADYIVVGSDRRLGPLASWKYSISQFVAAGARCPTIIVHSIVKKQNLVSTLLAAE